MNFRSKHGILTLFVLMGFGVSAYAFAVDSREPPPAALPSAQTDLNPILFNRATGLIESLPVPVAIAAIPTSSQEPPATPDLFTVSAATILANEQPKPTLLPPGAVGIPCTFFTVRAGSQDVHITAIEIEQTGLSSDRVFEAIEVADENDEAVANEKAFNSQHVAKFQTDITIPAGESKTFTVAASMSEELADYDGQQPRLSVKNIEANTSFTGTLPIVGATHTVNNNLSIGSLNVMRSADDPGEDTDAYFSDTDVVFSAIRVTAVREDAVLEGITWDQAGSAASDDLVNVEVVIGETSYPAQRSGREFSVALDTPVAIERGRAIEIAIRGDMKPSAARRTVKFDLRKPDDIAARGQEYGFGIGASASSHTATDGNAVFITSDGTSDGDPGNPFYSGAVVTILSGSVNSVSRQ